MTVDRQLTWAACGLFATALVFATITMLTRHTGFLLMTPGFIASGVILLATARRRR